MIKTAAKAIKKEILMVLMDLPDDASLIDIESAIVKNHLPIDIRYSRRVKRNIRKLKRINRELRNLKKKSKCNPKYLDELIPLDKAKSYSAYRHYRHYNCY